MFGKKDLLPIGLLILLGLIWGSSFILIKKGLVVFSATEVASLRVASAGFFLLPFVLIRIKSLSWGDHRKLLTSGMVGVLIPSFLFSIAQTQVQSSVVGIMNTLTPIWTIMIGSIFFRQRFRGYSVFGTLIGLVGTMILIISSNTLSGNISTYALLIVVATLLYGYNLNFIKYKLKTLNTMTIASGSTLFVGILATVYLLGLTEFTTKLSSYDGAWKAFSFIVILGLMSTAIASYLFNNLIKMRPPLFASSVTYLVPIMALVWGIIDGEQLKMGHYIGMITIIGGVYLVNKKRNN